jgi:hypothetical protein
MADKIILSDNDIKGFVFCDICAFDGYPYEKVVFKCTGFRSEDEEGFAYEYTVNAFENPDRIHVHRSFQQKNTSTDQNSHIKEQFDSINCSHCSFHRLIPTVCQDRICIECGDDHSFRGNFAEVITSIDLIPELLYCKMEALGGA